MIHGYEWQVHEPMLFPLPGETSVLIQNHNGIIQRTILDSIPDGAKAGAVNLAKVKNGLSGVSALFQGISGVSVSDIIARLPATKVLLFLGEIYGLDIRADVLFCQEIQLQFFNVIRSDGRGFRFNLRRSYFDI
jgi:hypothetical protein